MFGKQARCEVMSPSGDILSEGTAGTRARATAEAMETWLDMTGEQGQAKEYNASRISH